MRATPSWPRRTFLMAGLTGLGALRAARGLAFPLAATGDQGKGPCATATPRAVLAGGASRDAPVRGRLFAADGERFTPLPRHGIHDTQPRACAAYEDGLGIQYETIRSRPSGCIAVTSSSGWGRLPAHWT
jgi:hypothetical protein